MSEKDHRCYCRGSGWCGSGDWFGDDDSLVEIEGEAGAAVQWRDRGLASLREACPEELNKFWEKWVGIGSKKKPPCRKKNMGGRLTEILAVKQEKRAGTIRDRRRVKKKDKGGWWMHGRGFKSGAE